MGYSFWPETTWHAYVLPELRNIRLRSSAQNCNTRRQQDLSESWPWLLTMWLPAHIFVSRRFSWLFSLLSLTASFLLISQLVNNRQQNRGCRNQTWKQTMLICSLTPSSRFVSPFCYEKTVNQSLCLPILECLQQWIWLEGAYPCQDKCILHNDNAPSHTTRTVMYGYWSSVTWPVSDCTVSYRPVLSSEREPYRKKKQENVTKETIRIKSGHGPQRGARYQDEMVEINSTHLNSTQHTTRPLKLPLLSRDRTNTAVGISGLFRSLRPVRLLTFLTVLYNTDRLCGLVVRVLGYRSGGPG
jgi:hypothetical protein